MNKFEKTLKAFIRDESGLSAVEYGLLAAGIAVGLWSLISDIGSSLRTIYTNVQGNISGAAATGGTTG